MDYFDDGRYRRDPHGFKYGISIGGALIGVGVEQARLHWASDRLAFRWSVRLNLASPCRGNCAAARRTRPAIRQRRTPAGFRPAREPIVLDTRRKKIVLALRIAEVRTDPATGRITVYGVTEPWPTCSYGCPTDGDERAPPMQPGGFEASSPAIRRTD